MNISVNFNNTDIAKALENIITHPNKDEFIKLLTPMLCGSSHAAQHFFKAVVGNKLPDVYEPGTVCRLPVTCLSSDFNKERVRAKFADTDDMVVVTIKEFRGFHDWSDYVVESLNVIDDAGNTKMTSSYVKSFDLEVLEDF